MQVYSQPNAEYKLNNTTDNKNDKKKNETKCQADWTQYIISLSHNT